MRIFSILCLALLLAACSGDPHDTKVPADMTKWSNSVKPSLQKLTPDERVLFSQYVIRHISGAAEAGLTGDKADPIPDDMTIGKAIEEQRNYIARQHVKDPEKPRRSPISQPGSRNQGACHNMGTEPVILIKVRGYFPVPIPLLRSTDGGFAAEHLERRISGWRHFRTHES